MSNQARIDYPIYQRDIIYHLINNIYQFYLSLLNILSIFEVIK